jgi:hypothetical protein
VQYDFGQTISFSSGQQWHVPIKPTMADLTLKICSIIGNAVVIHKPTFNPSGPMSRHHPPPRKPDQCVFDWFQHGKSSSLQQQGADVTWAELYPSYVKVGADRPFSERPAKPKVGENEDDHHAKYKEMKLSSSILKKLLQLDGDGLKSCMPDRAHPFLGKQSTKESDGRIVEMFASLDQFAKMIATYRIVARNDEDRGDANAYLITVTSPLPPGSPRTRLGFGIYVSRYHSKTNGDENFAGPEFNDTGKDVSTFIWNTPRLVVFDASIIEAIKVPRVLPAGVPSPLIINPSLLLVPGPSLQPYEVAPYDLNWKDAYVIGAGAHGKAIRTTSATYGNVHVALKTMSANHSALGTTQYRRELWFGLWLSSPLQQEQQKGQVAHAAWQKYVVRTLGWIIKGNHFGILTEFIEGSSMDRTLATLVTPELAAQKEADLEKAKAQFAAITGGQPLKVKRQRGESFMEKDLELLEKRIAGLEADVARIREALDKNTTPNAVYVPLIYLRNMLRGIVFMHENKIVHKDLKPGNVLIGKDGQVKVADFGCSALIGIYSPVTGSPYYMPPYLNPRIPHQYEDGHADVYAAATSLGDWCDTDAVRALPPGNRIVDRAKAIVDKFTTTTTKSRRGTAMQLLEEIDGLIQLANRLVGAFGVGE